MDLFGVLADPTIVEALTAFVTVVLIDLVLAGDNAVVVGMAAAGLPDRLRRRAILYGIGAAALLRIVFALFATQLLGVIGLILAGGILLLWVTWKLWREIRRQAASTAAHHALNQAVSGKPTPAGAIPPPAKTFRQALTQIVVADVSMSLDNVLAVAGTARHHLWVLVAGLALSVALMGLAATLIARVLHKLPWISYLGLALIIWVAVSMIWEGAGDVWHFADKAGMI
ncbi:TerC family protein [soil metagenome]